MILVIALQDAVCNESAGHLVKIVQGTLYPIQGLRHLSQVSAVICFPNALEILQFKLHHDVSQYGECSWDPWQVSFWASVECFIVILHRIDLSKLLHSFPFFVSALLLELTTVLDSDKETRVVQLDQIGN